MKGIIVSSHIRFRFGCLILLVTLAAWTDARAEDSAAAPDKWADAKNVATQIDEQLAAHWKTAGVEPSAPADDAEVLRRVWLDLAGVIPPVSEVRAYLADTSPDKFERQVDHLMQSALFARHFATSWRAMLLPEADTNIQFRFVAAIDEAWLQNKFRDNEPYDKTVRELITLPLKLDGNGNPRNPYSAEGDVAPYGFYFTKEGKPENLASAIARSFLGVRIECAQCHDHPFADWKRQEFWGLAAFFSGVGRQNPEQQFSMVVEKEDAKPEIKMPESEEVIAAAFIGENAPSLPADVKAREALAAWVTSAENPYFARATVNRVWAHLLGTGIVDPLDDFDPANPPSHPETLDLLAADFVGHGFDLQHALRTVLSTKAYRLSSSRDEETPVDPRLFASMPLRGMSGDQVFDSVQQAVGVVINVPRFQFGFLGQVNDVSESFANNRQQPTEFEMSVAQALALMNGNSVNNATSLEQSRTLAAAADLPGLTTAQRIETLYLAALSRPPRAEELARLEPYVEAGGPTQDKRKALGDVFWALLNSSEFLFNH